jgi:plasmid stabilization system protein ParE
MPHVVVTQGALVGLARCRTFLKEKSSIAATRAGQAIAARFFQLETNPQIGRPVDLETGLRELTIPFGDAGYVALYRFDPADDVVVILAFRHQREAGYS